MKQCRFGLDDQHIDADLCEKIEQIANGGSWNEAARFYLRFLYYQLECQDVSPERRIDVIECTDNDNDIGSDQIDLSGLDDALLELGE
jgi:hypothetical protein